MRKYINIANILTEGYNRDLTLNSNHDELDARIANDRLANTPEEALAILERSDPTPKKAFVLILLKWYLNGSMRLLEDAYKATEPLKLYSKFRLRSDVPDISTLSFSDLLLLGDRLAGTKSKKEENKEEENAFYQNDEAELILDNSDWKVVIPKTEEAAKYFGRNTKWCTSAENDNQFGYYSDYGDLYIILEKKTNKRWQLHPESGQFMNELDNVVKIPEGTRIFSAVADDIGITEDKLHIFDNGPLFLYFDTTERKDIEFVIDRFPWTITLFDEPDEELQIIAVTSRPSVVSDIPNPTKNVIKLVLQMIGKELEDDKTEVS